MKINLYLKLKRRKKIPLFFVLLSIFWVQLATGQTIPSTFYGMNYWLPNQYINSGSIGGAVNYSNLQTLVYQAGVNLFRIGGNGYDENGTAIGTSSSTNDYLAAIAAVKAVNSSAKFIIQIPFESSHASSSNMSPTLAGTLVSRIKSVYSSDQFYYAIGNEWDYYKKPGTSPLRGYCNSEIKTIIKDYALEMKKQDANILIVAPAVSNFYAEDGSTPAVNILPSLIGGSQDITGIITGSGNASLDGIKYYIDIVDYHNYAGRNLTTLTSMTYSATRSAAVDYPTGSFANQLSTSSNMLQNLLNNANTTNSRTGSNKFL